MVTIKGKLRTERCPLRGGLPWTGDKRSSAGWPPELDGGHSLIQPNVMGRRKIPGCMVTSAKTVMNLSGKILGGNKSKS